MNWFEWFLMYSGATVWLFLCIMLAIVMFSGYRAGKRR